MGSVVPSSAALPVVYEVETINGSVDRVTVDHELELIRALVGDVGGWLVTDGGGMVRVVDVVRVAPVESS